MARPQARRYALLAVVALLAIVVPVFNLLVPEGSALHVSTFMVTLLGKYLCYALLAIALDLVWGYIGILSLGHGGVLRARRLRDGHVLDAPDRHARRIRQAELPDFMVFLNWDELPWYWYGFDQFWFAMLMVVVVPESSRSSSAGSRSARASRGVYLRSSLRRSPTR